MTKKSSYMEESLLFPTLDSLVDVVGNRYMLVNVVAKRAKEITDQANEKGVKLDEKPIRLAVREIADGKYVAPAEDEAAALE